LHTQEWILAEREGLGFSPNLSVLCGEKLFTAEYAKKGRRARKEKLSDFIR